MRDYDIRMDVMHGPLERIDVPAAAAAVKPVFSQPLCRVNDAVVRVAVIEGELHWHRHTEEDEFFYVTEGNLLIDIEDEETADLQPGQAYLVPAGKMHRPRAAVRSAFLVINSAGSVPTGD